MAEILTMACEACSGNGYVTVRYPPPTRGAKLVDCPTCSGTGRIPRPPLTAEEIAALPDGQRVVVQGGRVITIESAGARLCVLLDFYAQGVWLVDDSGEG